MSLLSWPFGTFIRKIFGRNFVYITRNEGEFLEWGDGKFHHRVRAVESTDELHRRNQSKTKEQEIERSKERGRERERNWGKGTTRMTSSNQPLLQSESIFVMNCGLGNRPNQYCFFGFTSSPYHDDDRLPTATVPKLEILRNRSFTLVRHIKHLHLYVIHLKLNTPNGRTCFGSPVLPSIWKTFMNIISLGEIAPIVTVASHSNLFFQVRSYAFRLFIQP